MLLKGLAGGKSPIYVRACRPARPSKRPRQLVTRCYSSVASPFKVQLLHPVKVADADQRPLLVFLPGTDGTGQAISPQIPALLQAGYDIRTLYIPPDDRSGWEQLQAQTLYLLSAVLGQRPPGPHNVQVTIVAESFGGCLALRVAAAAPHLIKALVLVNPATCYSQSLNGLSAFISSTNLLGLFPQSLYNTAQAVLLPFLVDIDRVGPEGAQALRSMIFMDKPPDYETAATRQLLSFDDQEHDYASVTVAAERRLVQVNSSTAFTAGGPQTALPTPLAGKSAVGRLPGSVTSAAATAGLFNTAAGGAGIGGGGVFAPAAAANFRANLMRSGNLPDKTLRKVEVPTLVISSAKDRMLPSIAEGARLVRLLPRSRRVILPDSGHAPLLERGLDLAAIMKGSGVTPTSRAPTAPGARIKYPRSGRAPATVFVGSSTGNGTAASSTSTSNSRSRTTIGSNLISVDSISSISSISSVDNLQQPVLLGIVKDDDALSSGGNATVAPRPATVMPSSNRASISRGAAAAPGAQGGEQGHVSGRTAAAAAAAVGVAAISTAGGTVSTVTDPGTNGNSRGRGSYQIPPSGSTASNSNGNGTGNGTSNNCGSGSATVITATGTSTAFSGNGTDSSSSPYTSIESSSSSSLAGGTGTRSAVQQQQHRDDSGVDKDLAWDKWSQYLAPWRDLVSPVLLGQEHLPGLVRSGRPLLFVGNHQKMGLYDMPLLAYELYMRGFKVKGLAHPGHWNSPLGSFFEQFGAVKAGPMTAYKLLKGRQQVLLFPGGAREVNKRVGDEYKLFWKDSPDFVRLAANCKAIIVPFAAVGADDAYDVMLDVPELLETPVLGDLVKGALQRLDPSLDPAEAALPLTRIPGLGLPTPVPIPRLERLYFKICTPVDTEQLGLGKRDAEGWQRLYDDIKASVIGGINELLKVRAADDQRQVGARIGRAISSWMPAFSLTQPRAEPIVMSNNTLQD